MILNRMKIFRPPKMSIPAKVSSFEKVTHSETGLTLLKLSMSFRFMVTEKLFATPSTK